MKNHVVIFCENKNADGRNIDPDAKTFCLPFFKIQEAMEFCKLEKVNSSYVGYRDGDWRIDLDRTNMEPYISVNINGIHESNKNRYVWVMKRINPPQAPYTQYQAPAKEPPSFLASLYDSVCN